MADKNPSAASEWRGGWPVVLAAFSGSGLAAMYAYTMGVMIAPLEAEFGWTRGQITSGFFVVSLFSVCFSLFMGIVIDRVGPRRLAIAGVAVYCSAVALLSQATGNIVVWWGLWALIAMGILLIKPTVWVAAISSLFVTSRGLALAVVLSASGFISFFTPMLTLKLLEAFDWRMTFVALGGGAFVIVMPLVLLFFSSARDRKRIAGSGAKAAARGGPDAAPAPDPVSAEPAGLSLKEGLLSRNFLFLGLGGLLFTLASVALTLNIFPILVDSDMGKETAAAIAGIIGIAQVVGRLSGGVLLDRFNARIVAAVSILLPIVTSLLLLFGSGNAAVAVLAVICLGFAAGAEYDAIAYLSARCFGLKNFAALFGAFTGVITLGFGAGPMLANMIYDLSGSYDPVLWTVIPLAAIAAVMFLSIGAYPTFDDDEDEVLEAATTATGEGETTP